jgi:ABC-type transport system substrate-binding protein
MSIDRDLYAEVFYNVSTFGAQGLPVETRWHSHVGATNDGWWLDPQGKDFGPNAKYFQHDLTEAKRLLAAAGYPSGFALTSYYVAGGAYGTTPKHAEVVDGMARELGINITVNSVDYLKEFIPQYRDGKGQYEGWTYRSSAGGISAPDVLAGITNEYWSKSGTSFLGFSANGQNDLSGDPQVDLAIEKATRELDTDKRRALIFDLQRYLAKAWYTVPLPSTGTGFVMAWPALANFRVFQGSRNNYKLWVDTTKPPFKPA